MPRAPATFEEWLDETFGRAVAGEHYPEFVHRDVMDWPDPTPSVDAVEYLTQLFEQPEKSLRFYSDRQIAPGLWELGPGDAHCVYDQSIPIEKRLRLVGSVEIFFRDFFDKRCVPRLSDSAADHISPLNTICHMWWEVITWGWQKDDPDAERIKARDLDVLEAVLQLPNPACKEAAIHGLGHMVSHSDRARAIISRFLQDEADLDPQLAAYARAASTGCIQ